MRGSTAGLADRTIASPDSIHAAFLVFLDWTFASIFAAPIVVAYWRGTWNLMIFVLFPDDQFWSAVGSCVIGTVGHFIFFFYQEKFGHSFHPDKHRITFMIFSRIYTALYGIICVNGWRGGWMLMDQYVPQSILVIAIIASVCSVLLAFVKGLRNVTSTPFAISTDHSKDYFVVPTMFKTSVRKLAWICSAKTVASTELLHIAHVQCMKQRTHSPSIHTINSPHSFRKVQCFFLWLFVGNK